MPSKPVNGEQRGWIIPIGGAEDKQTNPRILQRFVELSGGPEADIVVIPTASRLKDTGTRYEELFRGMGVAQVEVLDFDTRRDCQEEGRLARLARASGIFFTGGNQLRLSTILGGTHVARTIRLRNAQGVTVAGTSAGAGFLSEHMIAFGSEGSSPRASSVRLAPGLGLTHRFVIDQHFRQRDRLGRLTAALAYNPFAIGIGLDEDTARFHLARRHARGRGQRRGHRGRCPRPAVLLDGPRRRGRPGVHARPGRAYIDRRRYLQSAYAACLCRTPGHPQDLTGEHHHAHP